MSNRPSLNDIVSLAKRRGFVFPGSDIYGGMANTWDYGPLGAAVLHHIRTLWWRRFVERRSDVYPMETGVIMNPKVWEASGHLEGFTDPLVECKKCKRRFREDVIHESQIAEDNDGYRCPYSDCQGELTESRQFNLMFETHVGPVKDSGAVAYLRPETAQGMFVNFKHVLQTERPNIPFGLAQIGKAFRNEITPGNFVFRTLEFEQMEVEYFVRPNAWEESFEAWKKEMWAWIVSLGVDESRLRWRPHEGDELSHYSKRTEDIEFAFPFGWGELYGLAYRTDFDLQQHMKHSGEDLRYEDKKTGEKFIPHVVEPTFGVNRTFLTILASAYREEEKRTYLALHPSVAPYTVAVFPLLANKPKLVEKAREIYTMLSQHMPVAWDERGNIGKRYYAQDEIGTPWCVTVDFDTLEDASVTVRDRDSMEQKRIVIDNLITHIQLLMKGA